MKVRVTIKSRGGVTLRETLGPKADDQLIAETTREGLPLRPVVTLPVDMYAPARLREHDAAETELAEVSTTPKGAAQCRHALEARR